MSGVVVLDDFFPRLETGFRIAEFSWLLRHGVVDTVFTTTPLETAADAYAERYPDLIARVAAFAPAAVRGAELASTVFLNNAAYFLPHLEAAGVPFVLTLYPGGGLDFSDPDARAKLSAVLGSDLLRAVITTQPLVTRRVHDHGTRARVVEIPGVVVDPGYLSPGAGRREDYFGQPEGSPALRLCFVAHKYHPTGADKGYDVFLDVVRDLRDRIPVEAHVIGGFSAGDLPLDGIEDVVTFHGPLETAALKRGLLTMDLVVAPNRPGVLSAGAFDGFPTGSAIEAALCGVGMIAADPLEQNRAFRDGRDIVIIPPDAEQIAARILEIVAAPGGVRRLARAGLAVARARYGVRAQLWSRRGVILQARGADPRG